MESLQNVFKNLLSQGNLRAFRHYSLKNYKYSDNDPIKCNKLSESYY